MSSPPMYLQSLHDAHINQTNPENENGYEDNLNTSLPTQMIDVPSVAVAIAVLPGNVQDGQPSLAIASVSEGESIIPEDFMELLGMFDNVVHQEVVNSERGSRLRRVRLHNENLVDSPELQLTLKDILETPPISKLCSATTLVFTNDETENGSVMKKFADACSDFTDNPMYVSHVMASTMTLGVVLGANSPAEISRVLTDSSGSNNTRSSGKKNNSVRNRLELALLQPAARAYQVQVFRRPLSITTHEKNALRAKSLVKRKRKSPDEDPEHPESEKEDGESRVFANAVIIMIPDAMNANIKSCKVFTSGALHITGCLSISEGLKVAGAVGQIVRMALGLSDMGPHPVESMDVQMINTDFSVDLPIDRNMLLSVVNDQSDPECTAKIPYSSHASLKMKMTGMKYGTVLVFTTGKIMMTGFKNWLDLRKAFEYTVNTIINNASTIRSCVRQTGRSSSASNRRKRDCGSNSKIMNLLPPASMYVI